MTSTRFPGTAAATGAAAELAQNTERHAAQGRRLLLATSDDRPASPDLHRPRDAVRAVFLSLRKGSTDPLT